MMALALKDLIPCVDDMVPEPLAIKPLQEEETQPAPSPIVFGGLELLLPVKETKGVAPTPYEAQVVKTEAWSRGLKDAEILWQEQLSVQRAKLHEEFEAMKQVLAAELHRQLQDHIAEQLDQIKTMLANQVADILHPFIAERARLQVVSQFAEMAELALEDSIADSAILSGPENLLALLGHAVDCEKLTALVGTTDLCSANGDQSEISLQIDASAYETRLNDYLAELREAVKDD
nr:hypothetical protein [uncultured Cohaesibacter sp.]